MAFLLPALCWFRCWKQRLPLCRGVLESHASHQGGLPAVPRSILVPPPHRLMLEGLGSSWGAMEVMPELF